MLIISAACAVSLDICHLLALLFLCFVLGSAMVLEKQRKKVEFSLINFHCFASNEFSCVLVLFSFFCSFCFFVYRISYFFNFHFSNVKIPLSRLPRKRVSGKRKTWKKQNLNFQMTSEFGGEHIL